MVLTGTQQSRLTSSGRLLPELQAFRQGGMHTYAELLHGFALRNTAIFGTVHQRARQPLPFPSAYRYGVFQHAHIQLAQARLKHRSHAGIR
jgi:hypothetical protein